MLESFFSSELVLVLISTTWILLALFAAFGDALVGYIDEWLLVKLRTTKTGALTHSDAPGKLLLISGFFGFVTAIGALVFSLITGDAYPLYITEVIFVVAFVAGIIEVLWMIPYFHGLEQGGALNATPLFQTIPIFSLVFGLLFFSELPSTAHIIATAIIIAGAILLNYSPSARRIDRHTLGLMLLSSALISLGFFLFKDAATEGNFVATLFAHGLGMGMFSVLIWTCWPPYRRQFNSFMRSLNIKVLAAQVGNESLYAVSTIASQLAIVLGPSVMVVTAFNAFHPIFTLFIGLILFAFGSKEHKLELGGPLVILKTMAVILIAFGSVMIVVT